MAVGSTFVVLLGLLQAASPVQDPPIPGATGAPYVGEWAGMTSAIYNGEWAFVHKSPRVTTYLSRAQSHSGRNFDVTLAQVGSAPNESGQDMTVVVVNYQCDLEKLAILKVQQFTADGGLPPTMAMPRPRDWAGTGGFEVAATWLCEAGLPVGTEHVQGLGSIRRDAADRPLS